MSLQSVKRGFQDHVGSLQSTGNSSFWIFCKYKHVNNEKNDSMEHEMKIINERNLNMESEIQNLNEIIELKDEKIARRTTGAKFYHFETLLDTLGHFETL